MKKIKLKTLYLIGIITIGLIGLGIGSTYAMFTTSIEIDNPISISTTLTSESDVIETFDVEVAAGGNKEIPLTINNTSNSKLNYSVWYITSASDIEMGTKLSNSDSSPSSSTITSGETKKVYIQIKNNSTSSITVTLGVSSSTSNIVLSSSMTMVPNTELVFGKNLLEYITSLYNDNTKTTVKNNSITYNYATEVGLMNDRLGGTTTSLDGGNIRYYGASPNNYIYFNCSDYSNQSSSTCETWRIIGVFDGKVKIMRNSSIGDLAWDQDKNIDSTKTTYDNDWSTSSLQVLLNSSYYNGTGTITYYSDLDGTTTTSLNMTSIGIKNDTTRNMISETTYSLLAWNTVEVYSNQAYEYERSTGKVYPGQATSWTGKIALAYPSDHGYAADLSLCKEKFSSYSSSACASNNWMKSILGTSNYRWLLTSYSSGSKAVLLTYVAGNVLSRYSYNAYGVAPVLYLNSNITIKEDTDGTTSNPFKLIP